MRPTDRYVWVARTLGVLLFFTLCSFSVRLTSASRSSADYGIALESIDVAGNSATSADYNLQTSAIGQITTNENTPTNSADYSIRAGHVGQIYDIVALSITAPPSNNLNETASRQLSAAPLADDATTLANLDPSTISWSIISGPIASISSSGLVTAGNVYQDTPATVGGSAQNFSGQLNLTILNVTNDDFGAYANDGIDDSWQVQYFGQPPNPLAAPTADADGTGQNNLFKFIAGLNPLDGSRFTLSIQKVSGQPPQKNLILQPLVSGRTYAVQFRTSLTSGTWAPLTGTTQSDNGSTRTVTDLNASAAPKLYQVQITKP